MNSAIAYLLDDNKNSKRTLLMGMVSTQIVLLAYNLIFFNKYFPITEGWFSVYAELIRRGHTPYADFHLVLPPLYPFIIAMIFSVFGEQFIVLRLAGIVLMLLLASLLFLLMSRLFPAYIAAIAAITGVIYYQAGTAHITYDFIQFFTVFVLISSYFVCLSHDINRSSPDNRARIGEVVYLAVAGFFCSLAILTKHSNGVILLFILSCCVLLINRRGGFYPSIKALGVFWAGACVPLALLFLWLYSKGAFTAFFNQTLIGASESKGSLTAILIGWVPRIIYIDQIAKFLFVLCILAILGYRNLVYKISFYNGLRDLGNSVITTNRLFAAIIVSCLVAVYLPFANVEFSKQIVENSYFVFGFYTIIITVLLSSITFSALYGVVTLFFQTAASLLNDDLFILSMTSLGFLLGTATSGGIAEAGSFLGFSLVLGYLLFLPSTYNVGKYFFLACAFFLILFCASRKYTAPYSWWWITEPDIRSAVFNPQIPELTGFYLSENTAKVIHDVTNIINRYPVSGDDIFNFPNIPLFYLLTNKLPNRFIFIHWYDVLSDNLAIQEADRIIASPPKIIVYFKLKEEVAAGHELLFRGGKQSGQREITKAIDDLTQAGKYVLEKSYAVPQENVLQIWRLKSLGS